MELHITCIPGDGIGPEIVAEAKKVLDKIAEKYGHKIAFRGGIDKHVIRRSKEEIERELAYKMQPCMTEGGIVFSLDHRIPNGTPLENYIYYVRRAREILGLDPFESCEPSWGRMAF